jgi:hypothetical protein
VLSTFGRVSERPDAWVSTRLRQLATRCYKVRIPVPEHLLSQHRNSPPDRFLRIEDTALSCSPVQDLDKNMLDEDEARQ